MNLATIKNKVVEGIKLILVQPTMFFNIKLDDVESDDYTTTEVNQFEAGRPDLISLRAYGTIEKADLILKFNGISDPFSLTEGETIKIPRADFPFRTLERIQETEENIVKQQFVDTKRLSKKDQKRVEALKKKYDKENILPPNVVPVGKKTFKFQAGQVIFGAQAQNDPVVDSIVNPRKSKGFLGSSGVGIGLDQLKNMSNR
jgi:hypothetical protein